MSDKVEDFDSVTAYYAESFIENLEWNTRYPNLEEVVRGGEILRLVSKIAKEHYSQSEDQLRIVDVGCGRGWLTFFLSVYGMAVGLDPVCPVIDYAQGLYPGIEFVCGTPDQYLNSSSFNPFNLVVCSEVIEHVPDANKRQFLLTLASLLKSSGDIILTTPRGELFNAWLNKRGGAKQPVEDWLTERQLDNLAESCGLELMHRSSFYQVNLSASIPLKILRKILRHFNYQGEGFGFSDIYQVVRLRKENNFK